MKGQKPERGRSQGRGARHERSAAKRASILDGGPSGGYKRQHRLQRGAPLYCVKDWCANASGANTCFQGLNIITIQVLLPEEVRCHLVEESRNVMILVFFQNLGNLLL